MTKDIESNPPAKDSMQSEAENEIVLVTIHGTGVGEPTEEEDSWWLQGSKFLEKLEERLELDPKRIEIRPFLWEGGPNSEASRREAGRRLYELLKSYDAAEKDYYLICHSHGGSVAYSALLQSVDNNQPLERLKCWSTVGTPFLEYMRNKYLWQRLSGWQLWLYVISATTSLFTPMLLLLPYFDINWLGVVDNTLITSLYILPWPLTHAIFLILENYKSKAKSKASLSWITEKQKKAVAEHFSDSWVGHCHPQDEAVSALSNIKDVNEEIVKPKFLLPLIPVVQFLILIAWRFSPLDTFSWGQLSKFLPFPFLLEGGLYAALLLGFIVGLGFVLKSFALYLGKPISKWINKAVWSSVRENVWGDDVAQEDVIRIEAYPPSFSPMFRTMPDVVAEPLSEHSSNSAIRTLVKVREILGMTNTTTEKSKSTVGKGAMDLRSDLSKSLTWEELIHTSYFEVDKFIDLLALGLHQKGIAELKKEFIQKPQHELLRAWYEEDPITDRS